MNESLVQWTLLNNLSELSLILDCKIATTIGQEISTDFGRIDFILENNQSKYLVVELETVLNTKSKLTYCFDQVLNYKKATFPVSTAFCILYAEETSIKNKKNIESFGYKYDLLIKTYSLEYVKKLYKQTIERLSLNVGLALPNPKNYTICYLRWMNKILKTFKDLNKSKLIFDEIFVPFRNESNSKTNFNCYLRIATDFELLEVSNDGNDFTLTDYGKKFVENLNPLTSGRINISSVDLTNEQKRLLLQILTNGNWENKVHKVNIYWFFSFIEITSGAWLPKRQNFDSAKLKLVNGLFNVSYKTRTMQEFLTWCSNYCVELGLIEKIKSTSDYDQILLTPLGVEVNNIFSYDLTLKKSRMNLTFKYLE